MDRTKVKQFLAGLKDLRILVVGDLMLDEYLWGTTDRISPEAPVQVVAVQREDLRLGGAGNVIHNLAVLGCQVHVAGVVGADADGDRLQQMLQEMDVCCDDLLTEPARVTARKTRVLASNQQMLRIDRESRDEISTVTAGILLEKIRCGLGQYQVILISDYGKGVLSETLLTGILGMGRDAGIPVLVDPKGTDYSRYRGAYLLTPNRKEAGLATGIEIRDEQSVLEAGRKLVQQTDLQALVMTRSEEGMSLFRRDGSVEHLPTRAREVFDVSGAGDTVLVFIGLGLAAGLSVEDAARMANVAAGIVVGKVGTSTVMADEFMAAASGYPGLDRKLKQPEELAALLDVEKRLGKTVVFTNGCFDLLHVGHVKYLQEARRLGDLLVLGLNSDASIQRLKGPKRPLIGEDERAHILAALDCIDHVVVFDEDTPLELIRTLRPQILVKGGDYLPDEVVGKEVVEAYGGRVELIQFVDGKSSTNIIEKILKSYSE